MRNQERTEKKNLKQFRMSRGFPYEDCQLVSPISVVGTALIPCSPGSQGVGQRVLRLGARCQKIPRGFCTGCGSKRPNRVPAIASSRQLSHRSTARPRAIGVGQCSQGTKARQTCACSPPSHCPPPDDGAKVPMSRSTMALSRFRTPLE